MRFIVPFIKFRDSEGNSFSKAVGLMLYILIMGYYAAYGALAGSLVTACVSKDKGLNVGEAVNIGCTSAVVGTLALINSHIAVNGVMAGLTSITAGCSRDKSCVNASILLWRIVNGIAPVGCSALSGFISCLLAGDDVKKGALNGAIVGIFRSIHWRLKFYNRDEYLNIKSHAIEFGIYALAVAGGVAGAASTGNDLESGGWAGLFDIADVVGALSLVKKEK